MIFFFSFLEYIPEPKNYNTIISVRRLFFKFLHSTRKSNFLGILLLWARVWRKIEVSGRDMAQTLDFPQFFHPNANSNSVKGMMDFWSKK